MGKNKKNQAKQQAQEPQKSEETKQVEETKQEVVQESKVVETSTTTATTQEEVKEEEISQQDQGFDLNDLNINGQTVSVSELPKITASSMEYDEWTSQSSWIFKIR